LDYAWQSNNSEAPDDGIEITDSECEDFFNRLALEYQVEYSFVKQLFRTLDCQSRTLFVSGFKFGTNLEQAHQILIKILKIENFRINDAGTVTLSAEELSPEIVEVKKLAAQSCLVIFKTRKALHAVERIIERQKKKLGLCASIYRKRPQDLTNCERVAKPSLLLHLKRMLKIPIQTSEFSRRRDGSRWDSRKRKSPTTAN